MENHPDTFFGTAVVIGGGPAGSVAGLVLARLGWRVRLIERHRFPRDKVCGECLSPLGLEVLERAGLLARLRPAGPAVLSRTILHSPGGESVSIRLPRPMWGLSRHVLDAALLEAAREAGVEVHQPARCEGIELPVNEAGVKVRNLSDNSVRWLRGDCVLVSDGRGAVNGTRPTATGDIGIKAHFVDVDGPRDAVELFGIGGNYGGLAAIEGDRWNAAFSLPGHLFKAWRGGGTDALDELFQSVISRNATLSGRMRRARRVGNWMAAPVPRFGVAARWPAGVIPIGNAAAAIEPIGGEGMGLAMRSAELAAMKLGSGKANAEGGLRVDPDRLRDEFNRLWRRRRTACRAAGWLASSGRLGDAAVRVLRRMRGLDAAVLGWMNK